MLERSTTIQWSKMPTHRENETVNPEEDITDNKQRHDPQDSGDDIILVARDDLGARHHHHDRHWTWSWALPGS